MTAEQDREWGLDGQVVQIDRLRYRLILETEGPGYDVAHVPEYELADDPTAPPPFPCQDTGPEPHPAHRWTGWGHGEFECPGWRGAARIARGDA